MFKRFSLSQIVFYGIILFALVQLIVFLWLWKLFPGYTYPDTNEYLLFSHIIKTKGVWDFHLLFFGRAFTLPLLYTILYDKNVIIVFQLVFQLLSFSFLGWMLYYKFRRQKLSFLFPFLLMAWNFHPNIFFWPYYLLSESVALSMSCTIIGLILLMTEKPQWNRFLFPLLIVILFFYSHLKDVNLYVVSVLLPTVFWYTYRKHPLKKRYISGMITLLFLAGNYFLQQSMVERSHRYAMPLANNLSVRIMPDGEYLEWFYKEGFPHDAFVDTVKNKFGFQSNFSAIPPYYEYITGMGQNDYKEFLLAHPRYTLSKPFTSGSTDESVFPYSQIPQKNYPLSFIHTFWSKTFYFFIAAGVLLFISFFTHRSYYFPWLIFYGILWILLMLSFHGDANEIARHCLTPNFFIRTGVIIHFLLVSGSLPFFQKRKLILHKALKNEALKQ